MSMICLDAMRAVVSLYGGTDLAGLSGARPESLGDPWKQADLDSSKFAKTVLNHQFKADLNPKHIREDKISVQHDWNADPDLNRFLTGLRKLDDPAVTVDGLTTHGTERRVDDQSRFEAWLSENLLQPFLRHISDDFSQAFCQLPAEKGWLFTRLKIEDWWFSRRILEQRFEGSLVDWIYQARSNLEYWWRVARTALDPGLKGCKFARQDSGWPAEAQINSRTLEVPVPPEWELPPADFRQIVHYVFRHLPTVIDAVRRRANSDDAPTILSIPSPSAPSSHRLRRKLEAMRAKRDRCREEITRLKMQQQNLELDKHGLEDDKKRLEEERDAATRRSSELQAKNNRLVNLGNGLKSEKTALRHSVRQLRNEQEDLNRRNNQLRQEQLESENRTKKLQQALFDLQSQHGELVQEKNRIVADNEGLYRYKRLNENLQHEWDDLDREHRKLQREQIELRLQHKEMLEVRDRLTEANKNLLEKLEVLDAHCRSLQNASWAEAAHEPATEARTNGTWRREVESRKRRPEKERPSQTDSIHPPPESRTKVFNRILRALGKPAARSENAAGRILSELPAEQFAQVDPESISLLANVLEVRLSPRTSLNSSRLHTALRQLYGAE